MPLTNEHIEKRCLKTIQKPFHVVASPSPFIKVLFGSPFSQWHGVTTAAVSTKSTAVGLWFCQPQICWLRLVFMKLSKFKAPNKRQRPGKGQEKTSSCPCFQPVFRLFKETLANLSPPSTAPAAWQAGVEAFSDFPEFGVT